MKPVSVATGILLALAALAVFFLAGCSDSPAYPSPDNTLELQWPAKEVDQYIRAQGGIPAVEHKRMWVEAYEQGAIDQALTQLSGSPLITLETGDHGKLTVYRKTPVVSYEAPEDVKEAWGEKQAQEALDATKLPLPKKK